MSQLAIILNGNIPNNEIWYTTKNGSVLRQTDSKSTFRNGLKGHQYKNGKGVLSYNTTLSELTDFFFYNCPDLEFIVLPSSITIMGHHAFYECVSLSGVIVNDLNFWFDIEFKDYLSNPLFYAHDLYLNDELVTNIVVPENVLEIKDFAFEKCTSVKSIELNNVKTIGRCAFEGCTSFETITLPSTISIIEDGAFSNLYGNTFSIENKEDIPSLKMEDETVKYLEKDNVYYEWKEIGYYNVNNVNDSNENNTKLVLKLPTEKVLDENIKYLDLTKYYTWGRYVLISSIPSDSTDINTETVDVIPTKQKEGITYLIKDNLYYQWENKYIALNGVPEDASVENTKIVNTIPNNKVAGKLYIRTQNLYTWGKYKEIINTPYDSNVDNTLNVISLPSFNISAYKDDLYIKVDGISLEWVEKRDVIIGDNIFEDNVNAYFKTSANTTDDNSISLSIIPSKRIICENIKYLFFNDLYYEWVDDKYQFITNKPQDSVIGLKTIKINSKSTHFGFDCFKDGKNLETVIVDDVDNWFNFRFDNPLSNPIYYAHDITYNNKVVTNIHVPNKLKTINDFAFYNNSSLSSLTFDADGALERIGKSAFQNCIGLLSITLSNNINSVGENAFENTAWFNNQKSNTIRIDLHNGEKVLYYVNNDPYNITISDCVIADGAIMNKGKLTLISIGNNVKHIGKNSFYNCSNIRMITFESNVKTIGLDAFKNCESIVSVKINDLGAWCNIKFDNPLSNPLFYSSNLFINNENTSTLDIPDSNSISNYAFYNCKCIEKVSLPSNITLDKIGGQSFYGCINLKTVLNPNDFVVTTGGEDCGYVARYANKVLNNTDIEGDFVFSKDENDGVLTYKLIEYLGNNTEIKLPNDYKGNPYTLSNIAFENNEKIKKIVFSNGVNEIENDVFSNCKSLIEVDLSATNLKTISKGAFRNCINLSEITLPETIVNIDNLAFSHCFYLNNITLPKHLEFIGKEAFNNCYSLENIVLPNTLTKIEESAFSVNKNYKEIAEIPNNKINEPYIDYLKIDNKFYVWENEYIEISNPNLVENSSLNTVINYSNLVIEKNSNTHGCVGCYAKKIINSPNGLIVGDFVFYTTDNINYLSGYLGSANDVILPDNYNGEKYVIAPKSFKDDDSIHSIVISSGVTSINDYAFYNCQNLTAVTFGVNVAAVGNYAFANCSSLPSLNLNDKMLIIGENAFLNCTDLLEITFNQKYLTSNIDAFKNCIALNKVVISDANIWCNFKFKNLTSNPLYYAKKLYISDSEITTLSLTANTISSFSFINCENITRIKISDYTTNISDYSFYGCKNIASFTIPSAVSFIGNYAFQECVNLEIVVNFSGLNIQKNSTENGFIGYYAIDVINIKNGVLIGPFIFVTENNVHKLMHCLIKMSNLTLPESYNNKPYIIGKEAFSQRTEIKNIQFNSNIDGIEDGAFNGCTSLTTLTLTDYIEFIGNNAFSGCSALKTITFGANPIVIGNNAFYKCENITNINVSNKEAWYNNTYKNIYANPMYCSNKTVSNNIIGDVLTIPNNITTLKQYVLAGSKNITSITIPNTVNKIETGVFNGCTGIKNVIIDTKTSHIPVDGEMSCVNGCGCLETNCNRYENNEWFGLFHDSPIESLVLKRDVKNGLHQINSNNIYYTWESDGYKFLNNKPEDAITTNTKEVLEIPKDKIKSDIIKYLALDVSENSNEKNFEYYQWLGGYQLLPNAPDYYTITNTFETNTIPQYRQKDYKYVYCNKKYYIWWNGVYTQLPSKPSDVKIGDTIILNKVPNNKLTDTKLKYIVVDDYFYTFVDNTYKLLENKPNDSIIGNTLKVENIPTTKVEMENIIYLKKDDKYYSWVNTSSYKRLANKPSDVELINGENATLIGIPNDKVSDDNIKYILIQEPDSYYAWNDFLNSYTLVDVPNDITNENVLAINISIPNKKITDYFVKNLKDEKGNTISTYYKWINAGYNQLLQKPNNVIVDYNTKIVNILPKNREEDVTYLKYGDHYYKWVNKGYHSLYNNINQEIGNTLLLDVIPNYKIDGDNIEYIKIYNNINNNYKYYCWWDTTPSYVEAVVRNEDIEYGDTITLKSLPKDKLIATNISYIKVDNYYYQWNINWGMYSNYIPVDGADSTTVSIIPKEKIKEFKYLIHKNIYYKWDDENNKYVIAKPSDEGENKGVNTNIIIVDGEPPLKQVVDNDDIYLEVHFDAGNKKYYKWFNEEYNEINAPNDEKSGNTLLVSYIPKEKYFDNSIKYLSLDNKIYIWSEKYKPLEKVPNDVNTNNTTEVDTLPTSKITNVKYVYISKPIYASTVPAFYGNKTIDNIIIGENVKEIDSQMFRNCESLTSITIPNTVEILGDQAFMGCKNLRYVTIGNGVKKIGKECFKDCYNLSFVMIGSNVININDYAFYNCEKLRTVVNKSQLLLRAKYKDYGYITYNAENILNANINVDIIDDFVFATINGVNTLIDYIGNGNEIVLPNTYKNQNYHIGEKAFYNRYGNVIFVNSIPTEKYSYYNIIYLVKDEQYYKWVDNGYVLMKETPSDAIIGLSKVTLGDGVESIGVSAFENCLTLQEIVFNNTLKTISDYAFKRCYDLTEINLPASLLTIGNNTFQKCEKLTHVYFNNGLNIGFNAFSECSSLEYVVIDDTNKWFNMVFDSPSANPLFYAHKLYKLKDNGDLTSVTMLTTPEGIRRINDYLLYNCQNLVIFQFKNEITEIGSNAFNGCINLASLLNLRSSNVTRIGNHAFNNCTKITQITLGEKINNIGIGVFNNCTSLTNITFDGTDSSEILKLSYNHYSLKNGKGLLFDCPLTNITLNRNIQYENNTYCGISPFANITTLTNITINNNVTVIPEDAFYGCVNITKVIVNDLNKWCEIEFKTKESNPTYYANNITYNGNVVKNVNLNSASKISNYCFYNCKDLTAITINNNVSYIGVEAFKNCKNLENLNIGNNSTIKTIGSYAFENCQKIKTFVIPNEVQNINKGVFKNCSNLKNITINENINKIGDEAFKNCTSLSKLNITNLLKWMQISFYNKESNPSYYTKKILLNGQEITTITTDGENYTKISNYCFYNCTGLTSLIITTPKKDGMGISNIGKSAFENCINLQKVVIGDTVTDIDIKTFNNCTKLEKITIGNNISNIGDNAFMNTKVNNVYIKAKTPPTIKENTNPFNSGVLFYVPLKNIVEYKNTHYWKQQSLKGYNF